MADSSIPMTFALWWNCGMKKQKDLLFDMFEVISYYKKAQISQFARRQVSDRITA